MTSPRTQPQRSRAPLAPPPNGSSRLAAGGRTGPMARGRDAVRGWALAAQVSLGLWLVASCVQILWSIQAFSTIEVWSLERGDLSLSRPPAAVSTLEVLLSIQVVAYLASAVTLLVWVGVVRADRRLNRALLRGTTMAALGGWVVPVWRVRMSRRTLTDLWHASDPVRAGDRPRTASRATPPLVLAYSLLRILAPVVAGLVALRVVGTPGTADRLRVLVVALILGTALLVAAAVCLILVIARVTEQLRGRAPAPGPGTVRSVTASLMRA